MEVISALLMITAEPPSLARWDKTLTPVRQAMPSVWSAMPNWLPPSGVVTHSRPLRWSSIAVEAWCSETSAPTVSREVMCTVTSACASVPAMAGGLTGALVLPHGWPFSNSALTNGGDEGFFDIRLL